MQEMTLDKLPRNVLAKIDLQCAFMASACVLAAEELHVFRMLHDRELTASTIAKKTGIKSWRIKPFLAALVTLGLIRKRGELYRNTRLAEKYYVEKRSIYWTDVFSEACFNEFKAFSVLDQMLTTGKSYASILDIKQRDYIKMMRDDPQRANDFTHMLYYDHLEVSRALANNIDLSGYENVLDVGGGSGVMSLALVRKHKHINATVLELENVARVANRIIKREKLSGRVKAIAGDMNKSIPPGYDVIMLCDIEMTAQRLENAYRALPPGGMLVVVDTLMREDLTEPFYLLMWQLRSNSLWLITKRDIVNEIKASGFTKIKCRRLFEETWLITAHKSG